MKKSLGITACLRMWVFITKVMRNFSTFVFWKEVGIEAWWHWEWWPLVSNTTEALRTKNGDHLCQHDLVVCFRKMLPGKDQTINQKIIPLSASGNFLQISWPNTAVFYLGQIACLFNNSWLTETCFKTLSHYIYHPYPATPLILPTQWVPHLEEVASHHFHADPQTLWMYSYVSLLRNRKEFFQEGDLHYYSKS